METEQGPGILVRWMEKKTFSTLKRITTVWGDSASRLTIRQRSGVAVQAFLSVAAAAAAFLPPAAIHFFAGLMVVARGLLNSAYFFLALATKRLQLRRRRCPSSASRYTTRSIPSFTACGRPAGGGGWKRMTRRTRRRRRKKRSSLLTSTWISKQFTLAQHFSCFFLSSAGSQVSRRRERTHSTTPQVDEKNERARKKEREKEDKSLTFLSQLELAS